jgi:hypothetical protein
VERLPLLAGARTSRSLSRTPGKINPAVTVVTVAARRVRLRQEHSGQSGDIDAPIAQGAYA